MNRALSVLFFFTFSVSLSAQTDGEERNAFLHRSNAAANAYRSAKQQEYGVFLRRSWGSAAESAPKEVPFKRGDAGRPTGDNLTDNTVPVEEPIVVRKTMPSEEVISGGKFLFNLYGRTYRVRYNRSADLRLPLVSESDVASAWDALSARLTDLVDDCLAIRKREALCDWAYLQLVDSLSASFYYLCGDCDDHAILFSRLIRDLLGLDVLLVECEVDGAPHEATAVRFTEPLEDDTILYDGETYYCCEPTSNVGKEGQRRWNNYVVKHIDKVK